MNVSTVFVVNRWHHDPLPGLERPLLIDALEVVKVVPVGPAADGGATTIR
jgi:hypothetical protein